MQVGNIRNVVGEGPGIGKTDWMVRKKSRGVWGLLWDGSHVGQRGSRNLGSDSVLCKGSYGCFAIERGFSREGCFI